MSASRSSATDTMDFVDFDEEHASDEPVMERSASRHTYGEHLTVHVDWGGTREAFTVHVSQVEHRSTLFAERIRRQRATGRLLSLTFHDEIPRIFDYYLHVVYKNDAAVEGTKYARPTAEHPDGVPSHVIKTYCRAYFFAEHMGDCAAANLIIDALIAYTVAINSLISETHVRFIYDHAESESSLRKFAVDIWAYAVKHGVDQGLDFDQLPKAFLADVLREKLRAEALGAKWTVTEIFDYMFIREAKERYHCYNRLHPYPQGSEPLEDVMA